MVLQSLEKARKHPFWIASNAEYASKRGINSGQGRTNKPAYVETSIVETTYVDEFFKKVYSPCSKYYQNSSDNEFSNLPLSGENYIHH